MKIEAGKFLLGATDDGKEKETDSRAELQSFLELQERQAGVKVPKQR